MRAIVQRSGRASVEVDGEVIGEIAGGLVLLVGVHRDDSATDADRLANKVVNLRIFEDETGRMGRSILDTIPVHPERGILAVSNFTVYGDAKSSRRPSFTASASYEDGERLFKSFLEALEGQIPNGVATGRFGADMVVNITNIGPVTLVLDS